MMALAGALPQPMAESSLPVTTRPLLLVAAGCAVVLGGTVLLWAHYGTTVFFETIRVGLVACFG
jgi:hypothetical protein